MSKEIKHSFAFGPFHIDTMNRRLMREGQVVPLKAKAIDTLLLLIEGRGDVVEKEDLMKALWPDSFVEESNLTQHVYSLRKALGDGLYIETIPRRGYRFVADVRVSDSAASTILIKEKTSISLNYEEEFDSPHPSTFSGTIASPATIEVPAPETILQLRSSSQSVRTRPWLWPAMILLVSLLVIAGIVVWRGRTRIPFEHVKLTKFTTSGKAVKVAISPDGKYVAYVLSDAGQQGVWLRQMVSGKEIPLVTAQPTDYYGLTFSHDGNFIFYVRQDQNLPATLFKISSLGGTPDKLLENVDSPVTFSPDSRQLAFIRFGQGTAAIVIANSDGTGERTLVETHRNDAIRIGPNGTLPPSWSPDGSVIACPVSINSSQWDQAIYAYQVTSGAGRRLTSDRWPAIGRIEWAKDGNGILVTVIETETSSEQQIWYVPYPKGTAFRITNDLTDYRDLSLTDDARTIVTIQSERKANIWLARSDDLEHPTQVTATSYDGLNGLAWTPDGKLVYTSLIAGEQNLWITEPNGGSPKQLTDHAGFNEQPVVSPDGRYIVFLSNRNDHEHLWRIDIDGKHPVELTHGASDTQPTITADGQTVIFRSMNSAGSNLFQVSINGGEPKLLTDKTASDPHVSPDGKNIACGLRPEPNGKSKMALMSVADGELKFISDMPAHYGRIHWTPDGRGLAYGGKQEGAGNIWIQPLDGGPAKQLTRWSQALIAAFDWSRDGKWLAYAHATLTSDVVLISDVKK